MMEDIATSKKKRGRKPKDATVTDGAASSDAKTKVKKQASKVIRLDDNFDECIIAHLKLDPRDVDKVLNIVGVEEADTPVVEQKSPTQTNTSNGPTTCLLVDDTPAPVQVSTSYAPELNAMMKRIKELEERLAQKESVPHNTSMEKRTHPSRINFTNVDGSAWPEKTDIACWWCCHTFENRPFGIPDYTMDDTYYTFGCFCSLSCALAYTKDANTYRSFERETLLHNIHINMYGDICNQPPRLHPAPPRQALKMFGGHLNIQDFRAHNKSMEIKIKMPPMISITTLIEEAPRDLPINEKIKLSRGDGPMIRRTKPLPKNTVSILSLINK